MGLAIRTGVRYNKDKGSSCHTSANFLLSPQYEASCLQEAMFMKITRDMHDNMKVFIDFGSDYKDIFSIEYKGTLFINQGYNHEKYGKELFEAFI